MVVHNLDAFDSAVGPGEAEAVLVDLLIRAISSRKANRHCHETFGLSILLINNSWQPSALRGRRQPTPLPSRHAAFDLVERRRRERPRALAGFSTGGSFGCGRVASGALVFRRSPTARSVPQGIPPRCLSRRTRHRRRGAGILPANLASATRRFRRVCAWVSFLRRPPSSDRFPAPRSPLTARPTRRSGAPGRR